jgi:tuftelin-interacting protein 11
LKKRPPLDDNTNKDQISKKQKTQEIINIEKNTNYYNPKTNEEPIDPYGQNVGEFERHTRGIGSKIMEKLGWKKGQGLGPNPNVGILHPILVVPNPHTRGLGYVI